MTEYNHNSSKEKIEMNNTPANDEQQPNDVNTNSLSWITKSIQSLWDALGGGINKLNKQVNTLEQQNEELQEKSNRQKIEIDKLNLKVDELEKLVEELKTVFAKLDGQLRFLTRNKITTEVYRTSDPITKKTASQLCNEYQFLVQQDFVGFSQEIILVQDKQQRARIRSVLAEILLIEPMLHNTNSANNSSDKIKIWSRFISGLNPELSAKHDDDIKTKEQFNKLYLKSLELVQELQKRREELGIGLITPTQGERFQENKHEVILGCKCHHDDTISFVVYPGLLIVDHSTGKTQTHVRCKSLVYTSEDQ